MSDEWQRAYQELNKRYVQLQAQKRMELSNYQAELAAIKSDLQEAIDLIGPYTGFVNQINLDPGFRDSMPEHLQESYNDLPGETLRVFAEKWGLKW